MVTVGGYLARDGSHLADAKTVLLNREDACGFERRQNSRGPPLYFPFSSS